MSVVVKGQDEGSVLYPNCINGSILVLILYYSFVRCYIGENWVRGTWIDLEGILYCIKSLLSHNRFSIRLV